MLDILFPKICPSCKSNTAENLCGSCFNDIKFIDKFSSCDKCGIPFGYFSDSEGEGSQWSEEQNGNLCSKCILESYCFDKSRSIAFYEGKIRDLIIGFKYEGALSNVESMIEIITANFPKDIDDFDCVTPVPLHINKLRQREYNQSAILADGLAKYKGVRCELFGLKRVRETRPQIEIRDESQRRRNVKGAFSVTDKSAFKRKSVLVLDDVFTSGSTSNECSKILLNSGAYKVQVLTLARAKGM